MNNIAELLINSANLYENKIAMTDKNRSITYGELLSESRKISQWLVNRGIKQNDKVGISLYDSVDACAAFFAVVFVGAIPVMANPRSRKDGLIKQLNFVGVDLTLVEENLGDLGDSSELNVVLIRDVMHESISLTEYDKPATATKESIAFLLFTSGTSGNPMAISWAHGKVLESIKTWSGAVGLSSDDRIYCTSKIFSAYGISYSLFGTVANGCESFLESGLATPMSAKSNILKYKPTKFFSFPLTYSHFLSKKDVTLPDMDCYCSGYYVQKEVTDDWKKMTGNPLRITFGASEWLAFMCNNDGTNDLGFPMDGFEVRIADDEGNPVEDGVIGNLQCRSPIRGENYYNRPVETAKKFTEWMSSGDLAYRTSDRRFHYVARATDIITINGNFINPTDIEHTLEKFPGVGQAAVVGKVGSNNIEEVEAYIVLDQIVTINTVDLKKWVMSTHEKHACPKTFHIVNELPRTESGKIQKFLLKTS